MAVNPMALMQLKKRFSTFRQEHPKVIQFFHSVRDDAMRPGSIFELKITNPEGKSRVMNFRLTENDVETLQTLMSMKNG